MIDLELYRIFYQVVESGNITRASEALHISQPAITKQIKNLERELNTPLFIRTSKGVKLNEIGEKILFNVKQGLALLDEVEYLTKDYSDCKTGTIKIGTSTSLMRYSLFEHLEKFHNDFPNIILDIYTDPTKDLIKKLKNGSIDIIISKEPSNLDDDLIYKEIAKTKYVFAANPNYFNLNQKKINVNELNNFPILLQEYPANSRDSALKYFSDNHVLVVPKMNIASSNLLIDFIKMGYGIGYVTELYIKNEIKSNKIIKLNVVPEPENISYGIITLKNNILLNYCNEFLKYILKQK